MARISKKKQAARDKVDSTKAYVVEEALGLVKELATAKFPESVDVSVNLGVDPRKSDQVVRGSTVLPNGTGKSVRVAVFAQGENAEKAKAAGADIVGFEDLAEDVKKGQMDFDVVIATPDASKVRSPTRRRARFAIARTRPASFTARSAVPISRSMR
jgi:large subunit ribosomal protein L1